MGILTIILPVLFAVDRIAKVIACKLLFCSFVVFSIPVLALDTVIEEDTIKAIYSYKFGKFTEWPESKLNISKTSLGFCILGKNPFSQSALDAIEGKRLKGKTLQIKFFGNGLLSDDAFPGCHIVFISQSEKLRLQTILDALRYQPILTVSDIEGFFANGGMVTLIKSKNQIHFEINKDAVDQAGLLMSSKLLRLAKNRNAGSEVAP